MCLGLHTCGNYRCLYGVLQLERRRAWRSRQHVLFLRGSSSDPGSARFASATSSQVAGSFDVTFYPVNTDGTLKTTGADHVTGSFSAPICPVAPDVDDGGPGISGCD
jgi:hypothetical protein